MKTAFLLSSIFFGSCALFAAPTDDSKGRGSAPDLPNILWIVTDDQRSDSLACVNQATHGKNDSPLGFVSSPEIDKLAAEGTLFTHAYCNSPGCVPSRVSMLTGRYPHRNGTYGFKQSHNKADFCKPTFPEVLRDAGYHTARFGKSGSYIFEWGPGLTWTEPKFYDHAVDKKNDLQRNGLTDFFKDKLRDKKKVLGTAEIFHFPNGRVEKVLTDSPDGELTPEQKAHIASIDKELDIIRSYTRDQTTMIIGGRSSQPAGETLDGHIEKAFSNYLTTQKSHKPLFLNLGFHFPHSPVLPPQEFRDLFAGKTYNIPDFSRDELKKLPPQLVTLHKKMKIDGLKPAEKQQAIRDYYAFCAYGDSLIGKAVKNFRQVSEKANREWLVVIACGDHGWHLGEQGIEAKFGPYEMSNRCSVITLSSNKKQIPVQTSNRFIEFVDFAATFLHAAGVNLDDPKHAYFDGQSLISQANKTIPGRDYVIGEMNHVYGPRAYLRSRHFAFSMRTRPNKKGSNFKWGLTTQRDKVEMSLFDLRSDPLEQNNLANDPAYLALADWFRTKLGNIVLGDGRVEADWSKENSYTLGDFASGSHDGKLAIPADIIPVVQAEEATELKAGATIHLDFPGLGKTWRDQPARAGLYLPTDYTADKKFPLFVWFNGGAGSDNPAKAIQITGGKGFICLAVPYRSESDDQKGGWQTPWEFYKTIFDQIEKTVPNIDPARRVCGGFSSGGAAIMHSIGHSDGAFQNYFHAFMPGGAGWPMGGLETIKGRPMLAFMGDGDKRLPNFRILEKDATAAGIDLTFLLFKDTKHKLPNEQLPKILDWMTKNVINRDPPVSDLFANDNLSQWWPGKNEHPGKWTAKDGTISRGESKAGGLTSKAKPFNFKLTFEWKIAEGGNSGIKYRNGLEYQLLDDERHIRGKTPNSSAAALYDLVAPAADKPSKPAGQWNTGSIIAKGNHLEHWLNGAKVLEIEQKSADWKARLQKSKYKDLPDFGTKASGIHLQDHGANVHFRKVLLREFPATSPK